MALANNFFFSIEFAAPDTVISPGFHVMAVIIKKSLLNPQGVAGEHSPLFLTSLVNTAYKSGLYLYYRQWAGSAASAQ